MWYVIIAHVLWCIVLNFTEACDTDSVNGQTQKIHLITGFINLKFLFFCSCFYLERSFSFFFIVLIKDCYLTNIYQVVLFVIV